MAVLAGSDPVGIGTPGFGATRSFQAGRFSTGRSAGASTRHLQFTGPRSFTVAITVAPIGLASTTIPMGMASSRMADFTDQSADSTVVLRVAVSLLAEPTGE